MTFLGLAALGGVSVVSVWALVVIGRGISGARFNRALRAYDSPFERPANPCRPSRKPTEWAGRQPARRSARRARVPT
jgi:hypothetical protein